jgi:hypothetical protein
MASTYDHSPITGNQVRILHTTRTLAQQRYSILLTSQVPDHAFLVCNQVALLTSGRLHRPGSPQEIITDQTLSKLYDTAMRVLHVQLLECPAADLSLLCCPYDWSRTQLSVEVSMRVCPTPGSTPHHATTQPCPEHWGHLAGQAGCRPHHAPRQRRSPRALRHSQHALFADLDLAAEVKAFYRDFFSHALTDAQVAEILSGTL